MSDDEDLELYREAAARERLLVASEAVDLIDRVHSTGDAEARQRLVRANLGLVVSIAQRYRGRGLPFLDLVHLGNVGLRTAIDRFDASRGYRFTTYATWWVRQRILRELAGPFHHGPPGRQGGPC